MDYRKARWYWGQEVEVAFNVFGVKGKGNEMTGKQLKVVGDFYMQRGRDWRRLGKVITKIFGMILSFDSSGMFYI